MLKKYVVSQTYCHPPPVVSAPVWCPPHHNAGSSASAAAVREPRRRRQPGSSGFGRCRSGRPFRFRYSGPAEDLGAKGRGLRPRSPLPEDTACCCRRVTEEQSPCTGSRNKSGSSDDFLLGSFVILVFQNKGNIFRKKCVYLGEFTNHQTP